MHYNQSIITHLCKRFLKSINENKYNITYIKTI